MPDTGEPKIIQKVRGQFASWAAVSAGCMGINVATGIEHPWFLFPMFGMGIGLLRNYATLWQAGYSWRDVLKRPPAPDAVETTMVKGGRSSRPLPLPTAEEYGAQLSAIMQVHDDRLAIIKLLAKLPASELGGTRHLSAAQFVHEQRDSLALVASQDGRFTVFGWSQRAQLVHAYRVEALLL